MKISRTLKLLLSFHYILIILTISTYKLKPRLKYAKAFAIVLVCKEATASSQSVSQSHSQQLSHSQAYNERQHKARQLWLDGLQFYIHRNKLLLPIPQPATLAVSFRLSAYISQWVAKKRSDSESRAGGGEGYSHRNRGRVLT